MSAINLNNYEAYLLDYSEGNLAAGEIAQLELFITSHPELEIDLEDFMFPYLSGETESIDFKDSLKKTEQSLADEELLNYLEGNLSPEQIKIFELKLTENKELARDLALYQNTVLKAEASIIADFKSKLQKTEDDLILNDKVIAYVEKQLSAGDKIEFEKELGKNKTLQKELTLVSKTILAADKSIVHPDKKSLKKENKVIALFSFRNVASMAAALLLLIGFAIVFNYINSKEVVQNGLAKTSGSDKKKADPIINTPGSDSIHISDGLENNSPAELNQKESVKMLAKADKFNSAQKNTKTEHQVETRSEDLKKENKLPEIPIVKQEEKQNTLIEQPKPELASTTKTKINEDSLNKHNYLALEEFEADEDLINDKTTEKKNLWKRAVILAKQANKLGVKSIDGQEDAQNKYRLSFNSFSVEKK